MYCGCSIVNEHNAASGRCGDDYLKHCTLHAAAPELLAVARQALAKFRAIAQLVNEPSLAFAPPIIKALERAIARAEGRR